MNWKTIAKVAAAALVLGVVVVACVSYWQAQGDLAEMRATSLAQRQLQAEMAKQLAAITQNMKQWHEEQQQKLTTLHDQFRAAQSPEQTARLIERFVGLRQPITVTVPPPTLDQPQPQARAELPAVDLPQLKLYVEECETCRINLETKGKDLGYAEQQQRLLKAQLDSVSRERDTAIRAAKGGSFWQRFRREGKSALGAGAGAAAGAALCSQSESVVVIGCAAVGSVTGFVIAHF